MAAFAVLGAGGWGTALALRLAEQGGAVRLWFRSPEVAQEVASQRENRRYLPGHDLPDSIRIESDARAAVTGADMVFVAVPVQHLRSSLRALDAIEPGCVRVGVAKGLERETLLRVSEVVNDLWGPGPYAVLSGPSYAAEVARGEPTTVVAAAGEVAVAETVRGALATDRFRVEVSTDVIGVEVGGAVKNVYAIAAGLIRGLGYGANAHAAFLCGALAEMRRFGVALGARDETFAGVAGMGDLVLTGTGHGSRNFRVGEEIALGSEPWEALAGTGMVAEGVETARSTLRLAAKNHVTLPIVEQVVAVLYDHRDPRRAMDALLAGPAR